MQELRITNPQMQKIFEREFQSNKDKFMEFILSFVKENGKMVDDYFSQITNPKKPKSFNYTKLNPMDNFYTLEKDNSDIEATNPFEEVEDTVTLAKKLREEAYR